MNSEAEWRKALNASPEDRTLLMAYADWLEEQGEQFRACQVRQAAGGGTLVYSIWHPNWAKPYGEWVQFSHLKSHVEPKSRSSRYRRTHGSEPVPVTELVVVVEWRANPTEIMRQPYAPDLRL